MEVHTIEDFKRINTKGSDGSGTFMVYILTHNDVAIVVGHGKRNRAIVIFDADEEHKNRVTSHYKAGTVRLYRLFKPGKYRRFIISCPTKTDAQKIEAHLHYEIGGQGNGYKQFEADIFQGIPETSKAYMLLKMALCSSFSSLCDIKKWRQESIIDDDTWGKIRDRLNLPDWKPKGDSCP